MINGFPVSVLGVGDLLFTRVPRLKDTEFTYLVLEINPGSVTMYEMITCESMAIKYSTVRFMTADRVRGVFDYQPYSV